MKICIIQLTNKHTEIAGFIINYFIENEIDIYHPYNDSFNNCFPYYSNLFNKSFNYIKNIDENKYDKLFILSSEEINKISVINKFKYILIVHIAQFIQNDFMNISLTPLIKLDYILPIYDKSNLLLRENIISIIGLTMPKQKSLGDLLNLIKYTKKYKIQIFTRVCTRNELFLKDIEKYSNVIIYRNIGTEVMINYVKKSKFICVLDYRNSCYVKDRLSGSIPLGLNNEIPLILTKKLQNIYNLTGCLNYEESIKEILPLIELNENYNELLQEFIKCKKEIIFQNNKVMSNILKTYHY